LPESTLQHRQATAFDVTQGLRRGSRTYRHTSVAQRGILMKQGIHPEYREVCFVDLSNGFKFVTRSCLQTRETITLDDGRELPLFKLETSSESHPFYTGTQKSVDSLGGRVEKFRSKFAKAGVKQQKAAPAA
jgi:large subunit ribosomal protein L31